MPEINSTLWNQVLRFLSYRSRSEHEIVQYLKKKETDQDEINVIVTKLKSYNFINDAEFTRRWVESRIKNGKGKNFIYHELLQKGIEKQSAKATLTSFTESEAEAVNYLAAKLSNKYKDKPTFEAKSKLVSALVRRGFNYDDARSAVEKAFKKE